MFDKQVGQRNRNRRTLGLQAVAAAVAGLSLTAGSALAQTTIFSDTFGTSTVNNASPAAPTSTSTNYDVASTKASTASIAPGDLDIKTPGSTSAVAEAQALFTTSPVALQNTGDEIEYTMVFTDTANLDSIGTSSELYFGLFNSGGSAPDSGLTSSGLSTSLTTDESGGVEPWQGYAAMVPPNGGTGKLYLRPNQSNGSDNSDQDLFGNGAGSGLYKNPTGPTFGQGASTFTLTTGQQYTEDLLLTLNASGSISMAANIYSGAGTGGTDLYSLTGAITGANVVTNTFDGVGFGVRNTAGTLFPTTFDVNSLIIVKSVAPVIVTWTGTDSISPGSWAVADNWSNNVIPDAVGATANFASSNSTSVTLDGNQTVGSLTFNNTTAYTLASGTTNTTSTLTMDNGGATATALIAALGGSGHVISAPVVLGSNTTLNSTGGTSLTITGNISSETGRTTSLTIEGGGFVSLQGSNSYTGPTTIALGGLLKVQGASVFPAGGTVVNNGALSIQYGNILGTAVQGPVSIGNVSGTGSFAVGSNKNAYVQLDGPVSQGALTMMLSNGTSGVEALLDLNGQNASFTSIATGTVGLNVVGNSSLVTGSTLTITPTSATGTSTFSGTLQDGVNGTGSFLALSVGAGTLTLTGSNSYSGGTTIGSGADLVVNVTSTALSPMHNVVNNGNLDVEVGSVSGNVSGKGSLLIGATNASTLKISDGTGISSVGSLTINSGSAVDLTDNALIVNYGTGVDPVATIASYLSDGYKANWAGGEIQSSSVANANTLQSQLVYSVGYADGADGVVAGLSSGQIEILPTLAGDAKLAGNVVFGDFQLLAANFGSSAGWDGGNFTYGSVVNFGDFQVLAQNFGQSASGLTASELSSLNSFAAGFGEMLVANPDGGFSMAVVPEPASIGIAAIAGISLIRRRRRTAQ